MKYFVNIKTLDELKREYRRLSKIHHPDCGGDEEVMKAIINEHDELFEVLFDIYLVSLMGKARQNYGSQTFQANNETYTAPATM